MFAVAVPVKVTELGSPIFWPDTTAVNCDPGTAAFGLIDVIAGGGAMNPTRTGSVVPPAGAGFATVTPLEVSAARKEGGTNATMRRAPR